MKNTENALHDSRGDSTDRISGLLAHVLESPPAQQQHLLDELCTRHPDCATALRQGYTSLQQLGLERVAQSATGGAPAPESVTGGLPRTLGPFRLLEFLGAGGMGAVYRAEDDELKRPVALKLIRSEMLASERTRNRFQRESAALARLDHPGLCTVYRAGTTDGQPWIAMRLVRGTTLAWQIEARRHAEGETPASERRGRTGRRGSSHSREELQRTLLLFEKIARALATAHAAGVVHRDVKPANIVLTGDDEPVVIDFGLVHLEDSESHLTLSGDHIGTPAYMAPEQVEARGRELTPAADVYALAVTLFETLAGQSPYLAYSREELFVRIVRGERRRLRQVDRHLPADLEVVIEKALDVDPVRRYASMLAFAEDLRRVRQHEPPAARRLGMPLRAYRWCQRNPVAATFMALLSSGLVTVLALDASRQAARQRSLAMAYGNLAAQVLQKNADHALDLALRGVELAPNDAESLGMLLHALQDVHPHQDWLLPWPVEPKVTILSAVPSPSGDAAVILAEYQDKRFAPPALWTVTGCLLLPIEKGTMDVHWSPDGTRFVTACPYQPPQLWSAAGELLPVTLVPPGAPPHVRIPRVRFLPDGEHLVLACGDGKPRIHGVADNSWLELLPNLGKRGVPGLAVSADGKRLAFGDNEGCIVVHETADAFAGRPGRVLPTREPRLNALDLGATGQLLQVTRNNPPECELWTWSGDMLRRWGSRKAPATAVPIDPVNDHVLEIAQDHMPRLWRLIDGKLEFLHEVCAHDGKVQDATFGPEGRIFSVGVDGTARVADADSGRTEVTFRGLRHEMMAAAFLGSSRHCLVTTTFDVHRFERAAVTGPKLRVGAFADKHVGFPSAEWPGTIVTADIAQSLTLHRASGATLRPVQEPHDSRRAGICVSANGRWLASTNRRRSAETTAFVYGPGLELVQQITSLPMFEPIPVFGPHDQLLLVDVGDNQQGGCALYIPATTGQWQVAGEEVQQAFAAVCGGARTLAFHDPTSTLAVARDRGVELLHWEASPPALRPVATLLAKLGPRLLAFSPDGERLLVSCTDRVVRLVDRSNCVRAELRGHVGILTNIDVSPGGDRLLIAATDSGIAIYDLQGRLLLPVRPSEGTVSVARFMPDGSGILYGDSSRTTRIVPFEPDRIVELARSVQKPPMTPAQDQNYRSRVGDDRER